ncbi:hypothetical protein [Pseudogracilibacillus sp. SO30301A]|uniref:hypothetical protein n=1 Tax=Pseudogracilibacillus sp. SO30301A TaxID=3098291 RepID=UPI00300E1B24
MSEDYHKLTSEIFEKNIVGENIEHISGEYEFDGEKLTTSEYREVLVDGETYKIAYIIEHRDDFKIAEIIEFRVNGEKIDL